MTERHICLACGNKQDVLESTEKPRCGECYSLELVSEVKWEELVEEWSGVYQLSLDPLKQAENVRKGAEFLRKTVGGKNLSPLQFADLIQRLNEASFSE